MGNMLNYWNQISEKIKSLLNSSAFYYNIYNKGNGESYNIVGDISMNAINTYNRVKNFQNDYKNSLSIESQEILSKFLNETKEKVESLGNPPIY